FSSRRRHTRFSRDWSSDVCSSDLGQASSYDPHSHAGALLVVSLDVCLATVADKVGVTDLPGSDLPRIGVDVVTSVQPLIDHEPVGTVLLVAEVAAIPYGLHVRGLLFESRCRGLTLRVSVHPIASLISRRRASRAARRRSYSSLMASSLSRWHQSHLHTLQCPRSSWSAFRCQQPQYNSLCFRQCALLFM